MDMRTADIMLLRQVKSKLAEIERNSKSISDKEKKLQCLQEESEEPGYYEVLPTYEEATLHSTLEDKCNKLREEKWNSRKRIAKLIAWIAVFINIVLVAFSCCWLYTNDLGMEIRFLGGSEQLDNGNIILTVIGGVAVALLPGVSLSIVFEKFKRETKRDDTASNRGCAVGVLAIALIQPLAYFLIVTLQKKATIVALILIIAVTVISYIIGKKISREPAPITYGDISIRYSEQLHKAAEQDKRNERINESNCAAALKKKQAEYQPKIDACQKELMVLKTQQRAMQRELSAMDCLADCDKNNETVSFLIQQLENRRADSIKEALQQYDAYRKEKSRKAEAAWQRDYDRKQRERQRQEERRHQLDMEWEQYRHNTEMERHARQVEKELEEARKEAEERSRNGY